MEYTTMYLCILNFILFSYKQLCFSLTLTFFPVSASKDGVPMTNIESIEQNQAYNISAALTYTTQLVNVIAFYLGIKLPNKLCYR